MRFTITGGFTYYSEDRDQHMVAIEVEGRRNEDGSSLPVFVTRTQFDQKTDYLYSVNDLAGCTLIVDFYKKGEELPARDGDEPQICEDSGIIVKSFSFQLTPAMLIAKMKVSAELKAAGINLADLNTNVSSSRSNGNNVTPEKDDSEEDLSKVAAKAQSGEKPAK